MLTWEKAPRVLVLEDDPAIAALVAEGLSEDGCDVVAVHSCAQARSRWETGGFDLLVLDVRVPDGNGMELAIDIRRESDVGIIIITGQGEGTDQVIGLELGADDYLMKPFRVRELRARVKALLRRIHWSNGPAPETPAQGGESGGIAFHGYRLFSKSRILRNSDGEPVALTTLEFDLLALLAERKNTVLARDELTRQMRGGNWATDDRSIDGLVARLRQKLYDPSSAPHRIKTIRGKGYMLAE